MSVNVAKLINDRAAKKKKVYFIDAGNGGKSQIAKALFLLECPNIEVYSAGTTPSESLNPLAVQALAEIGADMSEGHPKGVDPQLLGISNHIVLIGADALLELNVPGTVERWITDDPFLRGIEGLEAMRLIRDDIHTRVKEFAHRLAK
ncbi:arsenate reductase [Corynebacterium kutscheri]|uniref:Arsenate reductase n=1 Tax=Corynebacterium kutscheri TaxID=35755 RepID=A0A0F6R103_9CORY|nr:low molecular weight phosphatase family protein [Corynebacterium kutscheri]AKE40748.1 protein-tyrosine-phosphatase [Corynebacterium kutscheri]VEH04580.1 arsenate reductase [Corynebacterium kutscheri]VEH11146.1 arsenate reductase [Corynebacterium kutscheri]VEH80377.1 arsenate reductase [Corynebacterium kutscheri]